MFPLACQSVGQNKNQGEKKLAPPMKNYTLGSNLKMLIKTIGFCINSFCEWLPSICTYAVDGRAHVCVFVCISEFTNSCHDMKQFNYNDVASEIAKVERIS